jgi:hypothetical protein
VYVDIPVKCVVQGVHICFFEVCCTECPCMFLLNVMYRKSVYVCVKCVVQGVHKCF